MDIGKDYELLYSNISSQFGPKSFFFYYWVSLRPVKPTFKNKLSTVNHYPRDNSLKMNPSPGLNGSIKKWYTTENPHMHKTYLL